MKDPRRVKGQCSDNAGISGDGRRNFVKCAVTVAARVAAIPLEPLIENESVVKAASANSSSAIRTNESFNFRISTAQAEKISVGPQADNGDVGDSQTSAAITAKHCRTTASVCRTLSLMPAYEMRL
jgi:hypothetical protein